MAYLALIAAIAFASICIALASNMLTNGQVFVPGLDAWATGYIGGIGAYVMALGWLSVGAFCMFAALIKVFPSRYTFFQRSRDIALITFALSFIFAVFALIVQQAP